ncbi:DUF2029 domain-containing protein [candidate division WOR-3 bacterium]|nr:DUF2029 domain-containing protein [candidate division WOR-3 bacterium]
MERQERISTVGVVVATGFVVAALYHLLQDWAGNRGYPFNTFLFRPEARFSDLLIFQGVLAQADPRGLFNYPPFTYLVLYPFSVMNPNLALGLFLSGFLGLFLWFSIRELGTGQFLPSARNVVSVVLVSYPLLFALDRANLETYVFVLVYLFVHWYRQRRYLPAAVCLSAAMAMKLYPAVFLLLPLSERSWRCTLYTLGLGIAFSVLGLVLFDGGAARNLERLLNGLKGYNRLYVIGNEGWYCGSSLFGALKFGLLSSGDWSKSALVVLSAFSTRAAVIATAALTYYLLVVERELWRKVTLLVLAMILLSQVSPDYKLMHLFTPLFLFINKPTRQRSDSLYAVLFALLLVPKSFFRLPQFPEASISLLINPLLMLLLAALLVRDGITALRGEEAQLGSAQPFGCDGLRLGKRPISQTARG